MPGKKQIATLASALSLSNDHVDRAHSFFKMAVEQRFIQGRKTEHVVCACMYIVCRFMKSQRKGGKKKEMKYAAASHFFPVVCCGAIGIITCSSGHQDMLLDFADVAQVNVYTLGQIYLKLLRKLSFHTLPIIGWSATHGGGN